MSHADPPSQVRTLRYCLTTKEFAAQYRAKEQSVRKQHAKAGAFCGVRPLVLPNGRLLWPDNTIDELVKSKLREQT